MSIDLNPNQTTEPEAYEFPLFLQGTGASAPTLLGRDNATVTHTSTGVLKISFPEDPGETFLGGAFGFGDATPSVVLGWSVCFGAYTAPSGSTPASLVVTIGNASNAAADLAATSKLKLALTFKQAPALL
ncbi:MAG TPA: hypothetical protein VHZ95_22175 [Polyangiales bacterium]|jgi:hypothetical protein|nr:hypothetical protein [Polyangiales bacterium]